MKRLADSAVLVVVVLLASVLFASVCRADDADYDALIDQAQSAHRQKDYARAAELFEQAAETEPLAELRFNAAVDWRLANQPARAADAYAHALGLAAAGSGTLSSRLRAKATAALTDLRRALALVRVEAAAGARVTVSHARARPVPASIHLEPGEHALRIEFPAGAVAHQRIAVKAGETRTLSLLEPPARTIERPVERPAERPRERQRPAPVRESSWESTLTAPLRIVGWTALAAGVAVGGVSVYLGVRTVEARDAWDAAGHVESQMALRDEAVTLQTWTNVTFGTALVLGSAGIVMLVVPLDESDPQAARLSFDAGGMAVLGRF